LAFRHYNIFTGNPDSDLKAGVVFGLIPARSKKGRLGFEPNKNADNLVPTPS
jgi:hypothetical protein